MDMSLVYMFCLAPVRMSLFELTLQKLLFDVAAPSEPMLSIILSLKRLLRSTNPDAVFLHPECWLSRKEFAH